MKFGVVVFPGTWSDRDCYYSVNDIPGRETGSIRHKETDHTGYECIMLPGGFSCGDYLHPGAIARFSPVMASIGRFASQVKPVIGICSGFQVVCESGFLPGILMQNDHLQYRCQWTFIRVGNCSLPFSSKCREGRVLKIPVSHYEVRHYAGDATLTGLEADRRIVFRYVTATGDVTGEASPNGSLHNIAGIVNKEGNIPGMMPHPERACEPVLNSSNGNYIWESV